MKPRHGYISLRVLVPSVALLALLPPPGARAEQLFTTRTEHYTVQGSEVQFELVVTDENGSELISGGKDGDRWQQGSGYYQMIVKENEQKIQGARYKFLRKVNDNEEVLLVRYMSPGRPATLSFCCTRNRTAPERWCWKSFSEARG